MATVPNPPQETLASSDLPGMAVIPGWLLIDPDVSPGSKFVYLYLSAVWPGSTVDIYTAELAQAIPDLFKDLAGPEDEPTDKAIRAFAQACNQRFQRWLGELARVGVVGSEPLPADPVNPLRLGHRVTFSLYAQESR